MPYSLFKKLGGKDDELIKTNMTVNDIGGGDLIDAKGVAFMELTIGSKTLATVIFVSEVQGNFNMILGGIGIMQTSAFLLPCISY